MRNMTFLVLFASMAVLAQDEITEVPVLADASTTGMNCILRDQHEEKLIQVNRVTWNNVGRTAFVNVVINGHDHRVRRGQKNIAEVLGYGTIDCGDTEY